MRIWKRPEFAVVNLEFAVINLEFACGKILLSYPKFNLSVKGAKPLFKITGDKGKGADRVNTAKA